MWQVATLFSPLGSQLIEDHHTPRFVVVKEINISTRFQKLNHKCVVGKTKRQKDKKTKRQKNKKTKRQNDKKDKSHPTF